MTKFTLVLGLICLGLLGAMPFIVSLPKPDTAQKEAAVQPQTAVERQIAAQRGTAADNHIRMEIGNTLAAAGEMAARGKYRQGLALIDGLQRKPGKTDYEDWVISQVRQRYVANAPGLKEDRQTR